MDSLFEYIIKNLFSLTGAQWLLVVLLSLVIGSGIFAILRWLYSSRFQAQDDVLRLKDSTIEELRQQYEFLKSQGSQKEARHSVAGGKAKIAGALSTQQSKIDVRSDMRASFQSPQVNSFNAIARTLDIVRLNLTIMNNVRSLLIIYVILEVEKSDPEAPRVRDLFERLDRLMDPYRNLPSVHNMASGEGDNEVKVPDSYMTIPHTEIDQGVEAVEREIKTALDRFFAAAKHNNAFQRSQR